jgi:hypothetical protein
VISVRAKVEAAAAAVVLAGGLFGFRVWLQEHDDRLRAQVDIAAQRKAFDDLAGDRRQHEAADQARDAAAAKQLEALQTTIGKIQTPQQIAAWLPKQVSVPQPITISVPPATKENPKPAAAAEIPQADLPGLRDFVEKCDECSVKLGAAQADLTSRQAQMADADKQIAALKNQRDDLEVELRGGTFWKRAKRAAHWLAIGGAAGAAALCITGHCK